MARPTGIQSRARRVPIDVDEAVQQEADRRGIGWADELRRVYLTLKGEPTDDTIKAPTFSTVLVEGGKTLRTSGSGTPVILNGQRCSCAKPTLSAASGMRVCTTCHLPRRA